jgi:regulator of replication initiation timing
MSNILPDHRSERPDKKACLRTYGLLTNLFNKASTSESPAIDYNEMLKTEATLRQRLAALGTNGIPLQMQDFMNELRDALKEMIEIGDEKLKEMFTDEEKDKQKREQVGVVESVRMKKVPPVVMVPITKVQEVRAQLKTEKEKVRRLNEENNRLAIENKMLKARLAMRT